MKINIPTTDSVDVTVAYGTANNENVFDQRKCCWGWCVAVLFFVQRIKLFFSSVVLEWDRRTIIEEQNIQEVETTRGALQQPTLYEHPLIQTIFVIMCGTPVDTNNNRSNLDFENTQHKTKLLSFKAVATINMNTTFCIVPDTNVKVYYAEIKKK